MLLPVAPCYKNFSGFPELPGRPEPTAGGQGAAGAAAHEFGRLSQKFKCFHFFHHLPPSAKQIEKNLLRKRREKSE